MNFTKYIQDLSETGEMTLREYTVIYSVIVKKKPCNLLVFGVGYDSELWHLSNEGGNTVFIENKRKWYDEAKKLHPEFQLTWVDYKTRKEQYKDLLKKFDQGNEKVLKLDLPEEITNMLWDIIIVDGPKNKFGRMKSIYMSSILAQHEGDVFLHDCDRKIEKIYGDKFLKNRVNTVGKLAHHIL